MKFLLGTYIYTYLPLIERLSQARNELLSRKGTLISTISDEDINNCNSRFRNPEKKGETIV